MKMNRSDGTFLVHAPSHIWISHLHLSSHNTSNEEARSFSIFRQGNSSHSAITVYLWFFALLAFGFWLQWCTSPDFQQILGKLVVHAIKSLATDIISAQKYCAKSTIYMRIPTACLLIKFWIEIWKWSKAALQGKTPTCM
jgi:hypothetical protein